MYTKPKKSAVDILVVGKLDLRAKGIIKGEKVIE